MNVHILNGDALLKRLPKEASGDKIIMREAMSQGPAIDDSLPRLFDMRAEFISSAYNEPIEKYYKESIPEIMKIPAIKKGSKLNLWFEHDLFCQVNLWFTTSLINFNALKEISLVLPSVGYKNGFGDMNKIELAKAFKAKINLSYHQFSALQHLWTAYCEKNYASMHKITRSLSSVLPLLAQVVRTLEADGDSYLKAKKILKEIKDQGTTDFGKIFQEFHKKAPIYGYGDLQVKYLLK
ncbi:DUF1835 domain-containing protein [Marinigracilibium pacificum]|uniref:DUF1835 domain-containing protein n=1 Tax=Marinigracilibium pacificum TaxID=2729599 RepID=A0A848J3W3_9BACT|nr:DUF1835 domain-containing protein [Marinigracilibium pacificum]NMM49220.1 DUF1835 domain-containing protein [Marinigracilibium pacificum]